MACRRRWGKLYLIKNSDRDLLKILIWERNNIMGNNIKKILLNWMKGDQDLIMMHFNITAATAGVSTAVLI